MNEARIKLLESFLTEEPENPFNKYALAMEYYTESPGKAKVLLEEVIGDHPTYLPSFYKLGHLYWDLEEWENAKATFELGIKLASKQSDNKALGELKTSYQNFMIDMDDDFEAS